MTEAFVRHDAGVQYLTSPLLASYGIPHLFSLRGGGVSDGVFASLNFAQGGGTLRDTAENVFENHARAAAVLGLPPVARLPLVSDAQPDGAPRGRRGRRPRSDSAALR